MNILCFMSYFFVYIQASWATSSKKQSDKLLEVIRRLAEDDKDGVMANKVSYLSCAKLYSVQIFYLGI